ncbi:maleylpyruvate isomerase family mycothiol-dependent enzyme [Streptomyces chumphonensis]|uniref:maleylpyruvate isomerase family mycothiol-dependent enzyme n=1 Tax=Streptomyces chumphonensis TaxID=1214925 RepID=UPI003D747C69
MMRMTYGRLCDEVLTQARALCAVLDEADLTRQVPTCPDWTLGELAEHVGQAHRWAARIVHTRATAEVPDDDVPAMRAPSTTDAEPLTAWLGEGAELLHGALLSAGPGTGVWSWHSDRTTDFWARRMTHETVIHRADACLAAGIPFTVTPDVATDTIDEWLELVSSPALQEEDEELRELRTRAGSSIHLHATDTPADLDAEWLIELSEDGVDWRRAHAKASVALRGELTDVLLAFYRRLPPDSGRVEVLGDADLLAFWLERADFS